MRYVVTELVPAPILWPGAFPLRVCPEEDAWEIWTRFDTSPGSRNNFAIATGIQHAREAQWICRTLNATREVERGRGRTV